MTMVIRGWAGGGGEFAMLKRGRARGRLVRAQEGASEGASVLVRESECVLRERAGGSGRVLLYPDRYYGRSTEGRRRTGGMHGARGQAHGAGLGQLVSPRDVDESMAASVGAWADQKKEDTAEGVVAVVRPR